MNNLVPKSLSLLIFYFKREYKLSMVLIMCTLDGHISIIYRSLKQHRCINKSAGTVVINQWVKTTIINTWWKHRHHKMSSEYHVSSKNHYEVGTTSNKISSEYHISSKNDYEVGTTSNKMYSEHHTVSLPKKTTMG